MPDVIACPHCGNKQGFVFGTCIDCGWNYMSNSFTHIKVYVDDLPPDRLTEYLLYRHAVSTKNKHTYT